MGISLSTVHALHAEQHDIVHLRDEGLIRLSDAEILEKARRERRIVLTFDLDFGDLLATGGSNFPSVVIFRLYNETPSSVTAHIKSVMQQRNHELESGALIVVEDTRHRVRRLPLEQ